MIEQYLSQINENATLSKGVVLTISLNDRVLRKSVCACLTRLNVCSFVQRVYARHIERERGEKLSS